MYIFEAVLSASFLGVVLAGDSSKLISRETAWPSQSFKSVSYQPPQLSISKSGSPLGTGLLVFTPISGTDASAVLMTDSGDLVWNNPTVGIFNNLNVQTLDSQPILTYWNGTGSPNDAEQGHGYGHVSILDTTYKEIYRICPDLDIVAPAGEEFECTCDVHESFVTERGSILVTAYNVTTADLTQFGGSPDGVIFDCLFFEIDIKTQDILFRWSALEAGIPINATHLNFTSTSGTQSSPFDWFHINSVQSVGDGYLVNSRHLWTTFMLNSTGGIQWEFKGDTGGDFSLPEDGHFAWEHHARVINMTSTSVTLTYFNNYNAEPPKNGTHPSEGLMFYLDLTTKNATLLKNLVDQHQQLYVDSQGSTSVLPNGNIFIDYGEIPIMKEYGPAGDVRMTIQFGNLDSAQSYRGYRLEWDAVPYTAPDLVAEAGTAYMSWNGATNVTSWVVCGSGQGNGSELVEIGTVANAGFETAYALPNGTAFVQVGAYSGDVLLRESRLVQVE